MSGSTSVAVSGGGRDGYRAPFTAVQWQELEHQALIYKYIVAGVPVPSDLVLPIRRSLEALSARLFHHPVLGYSSCYGKKFDPEPGRCRRTDGKKWRCSKEAYQESKYCERHMNRGRNRSRKPVESQSTSHSLSSDVTTVSGKGSYQNVSSSRSSSQSLYPITNSVSYNCGSDKSKLQMDTGPYAINNKDLRYAQGVTTVNVDNQNYTSGVAMNLNGLGVDSDLDNSWRLMPSQLDTNSLSKPQNNSNTFEAMIDANSISSKQSQQHCFLGSEIDQVKHEQHSLLPWSKAKEIWSDLNG